MSMFVFLHFALSGAEITSISFVIGILYVGSVFGKEAFLVDKCRRKYGYRAGLGLVTEMYRLPMEFFNITISHFPDEAKTCEAFFQNLCNSLQRCICDFRVRMRIFPVEH